MSHHQKARHWWVTWIEQAPVGSRVIQRTRQLLDLPALHRRRARTAGPFRKAPEAEAEAARLTRAGAAEVQILAP